MSLNPSLSPRRLLLGIVLGICWALAMKLLNHTSWHSTFGTSILWIELAIGGGTTSAVSRKSAVWWRVRRQDAGLAFFVVSGVAMWLGSVTQHDAAVFWTAVTVDAILLGVYYGWIRIGNRLSPEAKVVSPRGSLPR